MSTREFIGADIVEGILRCEDEEHTTKIVAVVADRNAFFRHGFQQRGLHFGSCAVDFVEEHEVGENRTRAESHAMGSEGFESRDVRWEKVRHTLDSTKGPEVDPDLGDVIADALGEFLYHEGFSSAWIILKQNMPLRKQGSYDQANSAQSILSFSDVGPIPVLALSPADDFLAEVGDDFAANFGRPLSSHGS